MNLSPLVSAYLWISALVGLLEILEAFLIYRNRGWVNNVIMQISIFEFVWLLISLWILYTLWNVADAPIWHPMLYLGYVVGSSVVAIVFARNVRIEEDLSIQLTPGMAFAGGGFGVVFFAASLIAIAQIP